MRRRVLILLVFIVALGALFVLLRRMPALEMLIHEEARLRSFLARRPLAGFLGGLVVYTAVSMVPGTTGKAIVAAWLYGFVAGLLLVNVGLTIAAMLSFFASRHLCREAIEARFGTRLRHVNGALRREGAYYLFAARVLHAPYCVTNYVMGATAIRPRSFWIATQTGLLPGNIVFVYAGSRLPSLEQLAEEGAGAFLSPGLLLAFVAVSVLPLAARSIVRRWGRRARRRASPGP